MHHRQEPPAAIRTLALHQAGVVTTEQVRMAGMSRHVVARLLRDRHWCAVGRSVYGTASEVGWDGLAWAGHLIGGEGSRLGARASAFVGGLVTEAPQPIDVLVPWGSMVRSHGHWVFRRERPGVRDAGTLGSPPRLTVEDTVLDLVDAALEPEVVELVTTAVQKRLTTAERLSTALEGRRRVRHRDVLRDLLVDVADGAESPLEVRFLRTVERAHGLPEGRRQHSRADLPYCVDVDYEPYPLLVELDGRAGHEGVGRFRDMNRDNVHLLDGRGTLRYGWFDVLDHPCVVAGQVVAALRSCGWTGLPTRCARCRSVPEGAWQLVP